MNKPFLIGIAALAGACAACGDSRRDRAPGARSVDARVEAREESPADSETPRYADQNRDGRVTRSEAQIDPLLSSNFDRYDHDGNGALDRGEFARLEAGASGARETETPEPVHTLRPRGEYPRPYE